MKRRIRYILLSAALLIVIGCERDTIPTSSDKMAMQQVLSKDPLAKSGKQRLLEFSSDEAHQTEPTITPEEASKIASSDGERIGSSASAQYSPALGQWWIANVSVTDVTQLGGLPTLYIAASNESTPDWCEYMKLQVEILWRRWNRPGGWQPLWSGGAEAWYFYGIIYGDNFSKRFNWEALTLGTHTFEDSRHEDSWEVGLWAQETAFFIDRSAP